MKMKQVKLVENQVLDLQEEIEKIYLALMRFKREIERIEVEEYKRDVDHLKFMLDEFIETCEDIIRLLSRRR